MLRACFWLLAATIGVVLFCMIITALACTLGVLYGVAPPGTCIKLGLVQSLHDWWAEILTSILALIAAGSNRPPPSPPPSPPDRH
jgi:hypothetical protein